MAKALHVSSAPCSRKWGTDTDKIVGSQQGAYIDFAIVIVLGVIAAQQQRIRMGELQAVELT